jgi:HD-GYP domain-containing protein (c-di-GMP phosphodiesterase class II)
MPILDVKALKPGIQAATDLLDATGIILIHKGVEITQAHIDALNRRHIKEVHLRDEDEDFINRLSESELPLEELDLSLTDAPEPEPVAPPPAPAEKKKEKERELPPKALMFFEELRDLPEGKAGFERILTTRKVLEIEKRITNPAGFPDHPKGTPLTAAITQVKPWERSPEYKQGVSTDYSSALDRTRTTLNDLREGRMVEFDAIQDLSSGFVKTFMKDRSILLNVAGTKPENGNYLFNHSLNVCLLSINLAAASGFSEKQVVEIGMGALLHDIGMTFVPSDILHSPCRLSDEEKFEVRKHPVVGLHLLERVQGIPESVSCIAYQHHERVNGQGYPKGRKGRFLHNFARIVMIADMFEAFSSPRAYRPAHPPYKAMEFLFLLAKNGLLDSGLLKGFISYMSIFPVGSLVKLNTKVIAKVVQATEGFHTRPVISVLTDSEANPLDEAGIRQIDLSVEKNFQIVQALADTVRNEDLMRGF